jgi:hypothetical protein
MAPTARAVRAFRFHHPEEDRMTRVLTIAALALGLAIVGPAFAQESPAAVATRKKLKQKISVDIKEQGTKAFFEEVKLEMDKPVKFVIDNASGVSNNTKVSYKGKNVTVEKLLNDMADKNDWGWVVISNPSNNRVDGSVVIRKSSKGKERGYEAGTEPKKKGAALDARPVPVGRRWHQPALSAPGRLGAPALAARRSRAVELV